MGLILIHVGKRLEETETWNLKKCRNDKNDENVQKWSKMSEKCQ